VNATGRRRTGSADLRGSLLVALLAMSANAHADWRRDYGFGQQAIDKGNWAEAETLMRSAQSEEPTASLRKRMQGTRFEVYVPRYYAGLAAFKQGSCARALDYFNDAATRDVVAQVADLAAQAQQVRHSCGGSENAVADNGKPPAPSAPPDKQVANSDAGKAPESPQKPPPPPVALVVTPAKPILAPPPAPVVTATATHQSAPAALRAIVGQFMAGNYQAALRSSEAGAPDARSRALLLLVRAAAGFTYADLKGGDASMVARAEQDVRASHQLARVEPDPILFSPKMRAQIARIR